LDWHLRLAAGRRLEESSRRPDRRQQLEACCACFCTAENKRNPCTSVLRGGRSICGGPKRLSTGASPIPVSHVAWFAPAVGSREPLKHMLVVRMSVIERRERTKPHTSLYVRFHFAERREASVFVAALRRFCQVPPAGVAIPAARRPGLRGGVRAGRGSHSLGLPAGPAAGDCGGISAQADDRL
jgi:hypothetical protein